MPSVLSRLSSRQAVTAAAGTGVACLLFLIYKKQSSSPKLRAVPTVPEFLKEEIKEKKKASQAHVDLDFFKKLWQILRIVVPGPLTAEAAYMLLVAAALLARTYADVWMIANGTFIESAIISRDRLEFGKHLVQYVCAMPAISVVNNMLKYGLSELKLRFRTRLSEHLYKQYLDEFTFYKMANIDNRIANADQLLTTDVEKFCESIVGVYSNLTKPLLDMVLYIVRLTGSVGFQAPSALLGYLAVSGIFLTWLRRPIGSMTVVEQQLEGEFRFVNSRLITNSEEIAFYQGNSRERRTITHSFTKLVNHLRKLVLFRFSLGFLDNIIAKYLATVVGFLAVSHPFLTHSGKLADRSRSQLMQEYYRSGRMMVKLAEAIGRLALAGRELTRLAGFTARMTQLMTVLDDLNQGKYKRTMVSTGALQIVDSSTNEDGEVPANAVPRELVPGSGRIEVADNFIRFENVPLVTPNGDVLIPSLDFEVRSGMNVLVCGPNGCGKSSLFRILGELWPLFGGCLTKPPKGKLFYIPQRPYMTLGSLRDQVIYPDCKEDMWAKNITDSDLENFLELVQLRYILGREGGWDAVQDWMDVLSGGEKQRVAMARVFYHKPQFAILDECTSAVSVDVEGEMYQFCRNTGITLFTVSHRKSLWKHHEYYLHMDGRGKYEYKPIDESTQEFGS